MKILTTISLFIFLVVVTAILTAGLVFYQNNKNNIPALNNARSNNSSGSSATGVSATPGMTLNPAEISKHNSAGDCWMIINSKVYNVTSYLSAHPGGIGAMTPYCGKEATQAFNTKGGRGNAHSSYADSLLVNYLVGNLNQAVTQQQIQQPAQNVNTTTSPASSGNADEFDD